MGYSYNDFVTKAKNAGLLGKFSQEDLTIAQESPEYGMSILGLLQDEQSATTAEGRLLAQEAAKTLRNSYGLVGQIASKQAEINSLGKYSYEKESDIQRLTDEVANHPEFSYDKETDPVYQSMRQTALRESERAVEDTIARASVGTGGVPSSYAVAAAQQAANAYTGQLSDAVPTLYQSALAKHENDLNMKRQQLTELRGQKDAEYSAHLQELTRLETELQGLREVQAAQQQAEIQARQQQEQAEMEALLKAAEHYGDNNGGDYSYYYQLLGLTQDEVNQMKYNEDYKTGVDGRPTGLTGHGLLTNTGYNEPVQLTTGAGKTGMTSVPVMQAEDGSLWRWDHMQHKYVPARGIGTAAPRVPVTETENTTPGAPVTETENTTLFRNTVMSPREFMRHKGEGKEASYNDYLLATLKRWHEGKRISDNELAWLMNYYRV